MTTKYMRKRLATCKRDPNWQHWVMGCAAGMVYLLLISWMG